MMQGDVNPAAMADAPMGRARRIVLYLKAEGWRPPPGKPDVEEEAQVFFAQIIGEAVEELRSAFLKKRADRTRQEG